MSLQFLKNNTPPPAQSVLQYSISPDTVFVSTNAQTLYANLTITVFNPQSTAVTCQMFKFGFYVGALYGDLTTSAAGIQTSSDQSNWTISSQASVSPDSPTLYQFSAPASRMANHQLAPNQSLVFHLNGILINHAVGEGGAPFVITEVTGPSSNPTGVQGEITISKQTPTLAIQSFSVNPPTPVNPGTSIEMSWTLAASDHWQLYDVDAAQLLYDSETSTPPNASSYPTPPATLEPQQNTPYELIAYAGQLYTASRAQVMVEAVKISAQGPTAPVNALSDVQISWSTDYANSVTIEPGGQSESATNGSGQFTVQPQGNTLYTLTAYGANETHTQVNVEVNVNPPSVSSFTATESLPPAGQPASLSWETVSATSATLQQSIAGQAGLIDLGSVDLQSTGHEVSPTGISTYILTAKVEDGREAQAEIIVAEDAGTFPVGPWPDALTFDGTYIWVAHEWGVSAFKASDGTLAPFTQQPIKVGPDPWSLAFDGTYIWVANNDNTLSVLKASDGTPAPFARQPIKVGANPRALAFDGTYIWVANYGDSTVSVLKASDGTPAPFAQQPIKVGNSPAALVFDGTYIWVANTASDNVSVLRASDGTPAPFARQPIQVGSAPLALAFDGTYIWVGNNGDSTVSVLKASDGTPAPFARQPIQVYYQPTVITFDGTYIWVANFNGYGFVFKVSDGTLAPSAQNPILITGNGIALTGTIGFYGTYLWVLYQDGDDPDLQGTLARL